LTDCFVLHTGHSANIDMLNYVLNDKNRQAKKNEIQVHRIIRL